MALPLAPPEIQFIDQDGHPYAGGTVETYVPGTTSPKDTWQDFGQTVLNTNPVILDAAGRAIILGDGDYRMILRDNTGQLVYDGWTTSIVSDAMQPVVAAPTIADALALLGLTGIVQAETDRATAAEAALSNQISIETARATSAESTLTTDLNAEVTRAEAAEANLQSQITAFGATTKMQAGFASSDSSGHATVTFPTAFTTLSAVTCNITAGTLSDEWVAVASATTSGFQAYVSQPLAGSTLGPAAIGFYWIAVGT